MTNDQIACVFVVQLKAKKIGDAVIARNLEANLKTYPDPRHIDNWIKEACDELTRQGVISPRESQWAMTQISHRFGYDNRVVFTPEFDVTPRGDWTE